ncbi:hypothetical protein PSHT_07708 [Puccinia striiformis]|uniref:Uncharacterized protein n=1 Tax=Puccinia striiformis TaxID=27350 RepID=A0A2S4VV73_9BASI|nr:hypothetical protein PSHT_07708 [Puccinia striiformis]
MNQRTGGQFGAQRILCKVVNHGTGGQFGAQGSKINLDYEGSSSDTETEIDELDPYLIDFSSARYAQISERARKTLQQTSLLSKLYHKSSPILIEDEQEAKDKYLLCRITNVCSFE